MPKRIAALAAVLVLTLTGCAGVADDASTERTAPGASGSAAPATVEPTDSPDSSDTTTADAEEYFLGSGFVPSIDLPDEEKIAAGYFACERVGAGDYGVVAVEGVDAATNEEFVAAATVSLCPELADAYTEHRQF